MDADDRAERLRFACPPADGEFDGFDLGLIDPADPDERGILISAEHPQLVRAIEQGRDELVVAGERMNPRLHLAMHEAVANQLVDDEPPAAWETARRLTGLGYGRHEVLHMLAWALSGQLWTALHEGRPYDEEAYGRVLASLPEAWEELRPPPRRERRAGARRQRRRR